MWAPKHLGFRVGIKIDLVFVRVVEIDSLNTRASATAAVQQQLRNNIVAAMICVRHPQLSKNQHEHVQYVRLQCEAAPTVAGAEIIPRLLLLRHPKMFCAHQFPTLAHVTVERPHTVCCLFDR